MEILTQIQGASATHGGLKNEVAFVSGEVKAEVDVMVAQGAADITLLRHAVGQRYTIYTESGSEVIIRSGDSCLICGALIGARSSVRVNDTAFRLTKEAVITLLYDGDKWRLSGQINE